MIVSLGVQHGNCQWQKEKKKGTKGGGGGGEKGSLESNRGASNQAAKTPLKNRVMWTESSLLAFMPV